MKKLVWTTQTADGPPDKFNTLEAEDTGDGNVNITLTVRKPNTPHYIQSVRVKTTVQDVEAACAGLPAKWEELVMCNNISGRFLALRQLRLKSAELVLVWFVVHLEQADQSYRIEDALCIRDVRFTNEGDGLHVTFLQVF